MLNRGHKVPTKNKANSYAPVQIREMLCTTYFRIRRYATGDPYKLCRFQGDREPEANRYRDAVVDLLMRNVTLKCAFEQISALGYQGKISAFGVYCRKLIAELGIMYMPKRNTAGIPINPKRDIPAQHSVSKKDFAQYLWSGKELADSDISFVLEKYPKVSEIRQCIQDFRKIYQDKSIVLLEQFIEQYSACQLSPIKSFASGLRTDIDAVKNSVISNLSNGFVEGNNNKIKVIKRMMYGRAKIDLLRIKVLFAR